MFSTFRNVIVMQTHLIMGYSSETGTDTPASNGCTYLTKPALMIIGIIACSGIHWKETLVRSSLLATCLESYGCVVLCVSAYYAVMLPSAYKHTKPTTDYGYSVKIQHITGMEDINVTSTWTKACVVHAMGNEISNFS